MISDRASCLQMERHLSRVLSSGPALRPSRLPADLVDDPSVETFRTELRHVRWTRWLKHQECRRRKQAACDFHCHILLLLSLPGPVRYRRSSEAGLMQESLSPACSPSRRSATHTI